MMKDVIQEIIKKAISALQKQKKISVVGIPEFDVEYPKVEKYGHYATNVALILSSQIKKSPWAIGKLLIGQIKENKKAAKYFDKIIFFRPGFINFTLKKEFFLQQIKEILKRKKEFGKIEVTPKRNKVLIEFISANPTGELHIGHGRCAFFGDVLARTLAKAGYRVNREYYINDSKQSTQIKKLGELMHGKKNPYLTDFVKEQQKKLFSEKKINFKKLSLSDAGYRLAQKIQIANRQFIEKKLSIHFDVWFSEEDFYKLGAIRDTLLWLETCRLTYKKAGALWMKTKQFGDEKDRVLVRKTGECTYFLSDIVYHRGKFERGFDKVINIWGADHHGYVRRMQAAIKAMGREGDLDILIIQLVRLMKGGKEFRMSRRKGTIVPLSWLINKVGLDVARFFFLMKSADTHIDFDLDLACEQSEKNPVYYVQYAHARIAGILRKARAQGAFRLRQIKRKNLELLQHHSELSLIFELTKFSELVKEISRSYEVHYFTYYAIRLADKFHKFYEQCRVLSSDSKLSQARLSLVFATKIVLANTLDLLNISAPEKM